MDKNLPCSLPTWSQAPQDHRASEAPHCLCRTEHQSQGQARPSLSTKKVTTLTNIRCSTCLSKASQSQMSGPSWTLPQPLVKSIPRTSGAFLESNWLNTYPTSFSGQKKWSNILRGRKDTTTWGPIGCSEPKGQVPKNEEVVKLILKRKPMGLTTEAAFSLSYNQEAATSLYSFR